MDSCIINQCNKSRYKKNLCMQHYYRVRTYGDPNTYKKVALHTKCTVLGCDRPGALSKDGTRHFNKGLCGAHYYRKYRKNRSNAQEYGVWKAMVRRCTNPLDPGYSNYGGRGIKVCDQWRNSFANFIASMGPRPSKHHQIDRTNNNGDYEPSNCRWVTAQENIWNRRNMELIAFNGLSKSSSEWSKYLGGERSLVKSRLQNGWSLERALTTPVHTKID